MKGTSHHYEDTLINSALVHVGLIIEGEKNWGLRGTKLLGGSGKKILTSTFADQMTRLSLQLLIRLTFHQLM